MIKDELKKGRVNSILKELGITEGFAMVKVGPSGLTSLELNYEFVLVMSPVIGGLNFSNLNPTMIFNYCIRVNIENYANGSVSEKVKLDLKIIKKELQERLFKGDYEVSCFIVGKNQKSLEVSV